MRSKTWEFALGDTTCIVGLDIGLGLCVRVWIDGLGFSDLYWRRLGSVDEVDRMLLYLGVFACAAWLVRAVALVFLAGPVTLLEALVWLALLSAILVQHSRLGGCLALLLPLLECTVLFGAPEMVNGGALMVAVAAPLAVTYPLNRAMWARARLDRSTPRRWRPLTLAFACATPALAFILLVAAVPGRAVIESQRCECAGRLVGLEEATQLVRDGHVNDITVRGHRVILSKTNGYKAAFLRQDSQTAAEMLFRGGVTRAMLLRLPYRVLPLLTIEDLFNPWNQTESPASLTAIARETIAGHVHNVQISGETFVVVLSTGQSVPSRVESGISPLHMLLVLGVSPDELENTLGQPDASPALLGA